ncbi:uncharacterized protein DNG_09717 [Cephalotrichum gorgonifer]|uniref:Glyoxalase-like domain-containing protein n=1 Tax=Cephalotrichum gorgonifer TaxID=2041049 RepID=A0AAE8N813_9PEZI|nr:uncharacterized protein DNG_09717 [Cephalotrichum gorgonifer]
MASQPSVLPILDHIVILVSYQTLEELPKLLEESLTVIEGGSHADGRTLNQLIIFPDGVYVELIAFQEDLDPERRKEHRWGSLAEGGIIDWAYTLTDADDFTAIQRRVAEANAETGVTYQDPIPGGRLRPDGVELKWAVSSAQDASLKSLWPGTAPFWCLDRTPRHLRVPYRDEATGGAPAYTTHPSGATGVSRVSVSVPEEEFSLADKIYEGVHGPPVESGPAKKVWPWAVHAGSSEGRQQVTLSAAAAGQERRITITLVGKPDSPSSIQVLPGLTFDFDIE